MYKKSFFLLFIFLFTAIYAGDSFYIHIEEVHPGQLRYSNSVVRTKIDQYIQDKKVTWDEDNQRWILPFDNSRSIIPLSDALPVIHSPLGYVLVDGHHHYLTNQAFDGSTFPIKVIGDFSELSSAEFLNKAEKLGYIHPYNVYGVRMELPTSFIELQNDPNREFASLSKRKYTACFDHDHSKGHEYPIWLKVGKDIPFIEMKISEAMWNAGLVFDGTYDTAFYEAARQSVISYKIRGLRVIPSRTYYRDIDFSQFPQAIQ